MRRSLCLNTSFVQHVTYFDKPLGAEASTISRTHTVLAALLLVTPCMASCAATASPNKVKYQELSVLTDGSVARYQARTACTLYSDDMNVGDAHTDCEPEPAIPIGYSVRSRDANTTTLDQYLPQRSNIFLLKMDVEGFEGQVDSTYKHGPVLLL